jgi:hypothetical protein
LLLALLLTRRLLGEPFLLAPVLLYGRLVRPSDKLLTRVLGHMPAAGTTGCPKWITSNRSPSLMSQKQFALTIANEHTRPSTFRAGRWLLCLIAHRILLAFFPTVTVLLGRA